jgi:hypothetical protein
MGIIFTRVFMRLIKSNTIGIEHAACLHVLKNAFFASILITLDSCSVVAYNNGVNHLDFVLS